MCIASSPEKVLIYVTTWLSSSYFLFSLLLREPIRNFTRGYVPFVVLTLLVSWSYEGCIVINIIAPAKPFRYENVGQFVNASQKVVTNSANINLPSYINESSPIFYMELKKFGVVDPKIMKRYFKIVRNEIFLPDEVLIGWKNLSSLGYLDSRISSFVRISLERWQTYADLRRVQGQRDTLRCNQFPFGHVKMSFSKFAFALERKAIGFHNVFIENGMSAFGDRINFEEFRIYTAKIERVTYQNKTTRGIDGLILLKHLNSIFQLQAVLLSILAVVFLGEKCVCVEIPINGNGSQVWQSQN